MTKFVETDATHFKSVVQSLTGKDAVVAEVVSRKRSSVEEVGGDNKRREWIGDLVQGNVMIEIPPSLQENVVREIPLSLEDLYDLWALC